MPAKPYSKKAKQTTGGQPGIRGYLIQTLIALLEELAPEQTFDRLTLEPNHTSEKFDLLWKDAKQTRAVQVKSSSNPFTKADVHRWAAEMEASAHADEYRLCLVGLPSPAVAKLRQVGKVILEVRNLDLAAFYEQAAHRLERFLRAEGLHPGTPDDREMLAHALAGRLGDYSTTGEPLSRAVLIKLLKTWVTAAPTREPRIAPTRLRVTGKEFVGREREMLLLDTAFDPSSDRKINIVSLIGQGGEGKTAIVLNWYARRARRGWQNARRIFDWSFYSQGTSAQSAASADEFFGKAFEWFGHVGEVPRDPWAKGEKLAELIAAERTLLVLDGLEPLQQPPGDYGGEFKDPAMKALLRALAMRNPGLCILTSRTDITDLKDFEHEGGCCLRHPLHRMDTEAARSLLRRLGVKGPDKDLDEAITWFHGHAYDLNLLGNYLAKCTDDHDIRRWKEVLLLKEDEHVRPKPDASGKKEGHGRRMLRAYERWLGPGTPAVAILHLLGLFDRPVRSDLLDELRAKPAIPGLTGTLVDLPEDEWFRALDHLQQLGLVAREQLKESAKPASLLKAIRAARSVRYTVDTHPLLREHFAVELPSDNVEAWRTAHRRLYEYLRDSTPDLPQPTLDDLQPLYQAVAHGCRAGLQQEVCDKIYRDRILRGEEQYSMYRLGAFGSEMGAIACFFNQPWTRLVSGLIDPAQAWLLNQAAFCLRALGRLAESKEPTRASLDLCVNLAAWEPAAGVASSLSLLELTLGEVAQAKVDAEQSVAYADRSGDRFRRMVSRVQHATILHQAGQGVDAEKHFSEGESVQAKGQPAYPLLYSLSGFLYCDLLLASVERAAWRVTLDLDCGLQSSDVAERCQVTEQRARKSLSWDGIACQANMIGPALDHLTLGRAALYRAILGESEIRDSKSEIETGVTDLHRAGTQHMIPHGVLTRAWLRFMEDAAAGALADLDEAWEIAERGSMRLYMADIHLYRARLLHGVRPYPWDKDEQGRPRGPIDDLAAARELIERCGYHRRDEERADAEKAAKHW